jgi:hypothetical protein
VIPGLIDNHMHLLPAGTTWQWEVRLDNIASRAEALDRLRARAKTVGPGEWIYTLGAWAIEQFADDSREFTRAELDRVAPANPLLLQASYYQTYLKTIGAIRALCCHGVTECPLCDPIGQVRLLEGSAALQPLAVWCRQRDSRGRVLRIARRPHPQQLDRLDDAFLFKQTIDQEPYTRQRDKLRQELALARVDRHATALDELDVEGILAFAEEVLPIAAHLWTHASLNQRQRLQQVFFPEGIGCSRNQLNRTTVTTPFFSRLGQFEEEILEWWARVESNHRPLACEANALPLSHAPDRTISVPRPLSHRQHEATHRSNGSNVEPGTRSPETKAQRPKIEAPEPYVVP